MPRPNPEHTLEEAKTNRHNKRLSRIKYLCERCEDENLHELADALKNIYGEVEVDKFFRILQKWAF